MGQYWVEQITEGLVYFKNGSENLVIPLGLIPGRVAIGDIVRIDHDVTTGHIRGLKVILKNITERSYE